MAKPRFTLYKHINIGGTWRYCRAAVAVNNKLKPPADNGFRHRRPAPNRSWVRHAWDLHLRTPDADTCEPDTWREELFTLG